MNWNSSFDFAGPKQLVFGVGTIKRIGEIASSMGSKSPMIVTDPVLYKVGLTSDAEVSLKNAGLSTTIFSDITTEPTVASVNAAVEMYRGNQCDLLIAIGGGSSIDSAKSISILLGNEGEITEFQAQRTGSNWTAAKPITKIGSEIIAVPTTSGTGSEMTGGSGVRDPKTGIKGWAGSPLLKPSVALCDPELSVSMPPHVTADTGTDAFSQGLECILVNKFKPTAEAIAYECLAVIKEYLPKAFGNGADIEARSAMMWAATNVGIAFGNAGLIHNHSFSEVLGDVVGLSHGRALGIMLPHVVEFNLPASQDKMAKVAVVMGEDTKGLSQRECAELGLQSVIDLMEDVEVFNKLSDYGATQDHLNIAADRIWDQHTPRSIISPKGFKSRDEILALMQAAF